MNRLKLFMFVSLLMLTTGIFAQDEWTGAKQITSVQVVNNGGFIINLDSEVNPVCTKSGISSILIYPKQNDVTFEGVKSLLSTALIAFSTGNKVNVMYSNDSVYCWGNSLLISK